ncbi:MAG: SurA N-terminal domain-containing protein [Desulfofustis sp.]|nr:SurA N-terminal domain-containing protein [Desulfofustis sp.]
MVANQKFFLLLIPTCFIFLLSLFTIANGEVVDRVVAEVNNEVITLSEIEEEGKGQFKQIALEVAPENRFNAIEQLRKDILRSMIDQKLIRQEAAEQGIIVTSEEIDGMVEQTLLANNITKEQLLTELEANDIDEDSFRSNLESQIYQTKLLNRDVRSRIVITEEAILDFYDTSYTKHIPEGGYYLLQIGISWGETQGENLDPAELEERKLSALQRAERVHKLAQSGSDFKELARKFSDLPSAVEGGDIGVFEEDEMASYMRGAVISLNPGQVSALIETPVGYQFFKLLSSKQGGIVTIAPYSEVKEEIREKLYDQELRKEFKEWIEQIRGEAYIRTSL